MSAMRSHRRRRNEGALFLALFLGAACAGQSSNAISGEAPPSALRQGAGPRPLIPITPRALLDRVRASPARITVLNVWATWCAPCRAELPDFVRLRRTYADRGVDVVLLSGDAVEQRDAAAELLAELGVDFETFAREGDDVELIETLNPAWSGALPATIVFGANGERLGFIEGLTTYGALERAVLDALDHAAPPSEQHGRAQMMQHAGSSVSQAEAVQSPVSPREMIEESLRR